jgi:hypothetical protein
MPGLRLGASVVLMRWIMTGNLSLDLPNEWNITGLGGRATPKTGCMTNWPRFWPFSAAESASS